MGKHSSTTEKDGSGMIETKMRQIIKKHFGKRMLIQPIESHATNGIPDIFFHDEESGWAELKQLDGLMVPFRPGQYAWIKRFVSLGGLALLICTTRDGVWIVFQGENILQDYRDLDWFSMASWYGRELPESVFKRFPI